MIIHIFIYNFRITSKTVASRPVGTDKDCLSTVLFSSGTLSVFVFPFYLDISPQWLCRMTMLGRSAQYFQDILKEPEVLRDSKCEEIVRKAWDYFEMSYEKKLNYWTENTKPSRWPQLLAALSYAEVRFWAKTNN